MSEAPVIYVRTYRPSETVSERLLAALYRSTISLCGFPAMSIGAAECDVVSKRTLPTGIQVTLLRMGSLQSPRAVRVIAKSSSDCLEFARTTDSLDTLAQEYLTMPRSQVLRQQSRVRRDSTLQ